MITRRYISGGEKTTTGLSPEEEAKVKTAIENAQEQAYAAQLKEGSIGRTQRVISGFTPHFFMGVVVMVGVALFLGFCFYVWFKECGDKKDIGDHMICVIDYVFDLMMKAIGNFFKMIGQWILKLFHL